jgi:hypothetical protein
MPIGLSHATNQFIGTQKNLVMLSIFLSVFSVLLPFLGEKMAYGVEFFSSNETVFNIPYDRLVADYWNWEVGMSSDESTPKQDGCLMNNNGSVVMLKGPAVVGSPRQVCEITSDQAIMIPLWVAWCDNTPGGRERDPNVPLSKCAREEYNLGNIKSDVKVDGVLVARLDVRMSLVSGSLDYKIFTLDNVSEIVTSNFKLVVPPNTQMPNLPAGTWDAGSHGWWVFLKPLPPGDHTIFYNIRVTPTGALTSPGTNPHFADITYLMKVK